MATSNQIVEENALPGNPESEWGLANGPNSNIEGFTTDISVNVGDEVDFKINTNAAHYRIDIYRLGYYGGDGARLVGSIEHNAADATVQPDPIIDLSTGLVDAGNWKVTDSWQTPTDLVSGVYIAKLVREDGTVGENHIPFVVRDEDSHSNIVFQTADASWQAYNTWGGSSLYSTSLPVQELGDPSIPDLHRAYEVSYNRPTQTYLVNGSLFGQEYAAIRWLEENGYDVTYQTSVDTARNGDLLLNHEVFMNAGHDEYWSHEQRANVEAARDAGVNLVFMGGNQVYWATRWESDVTGSDYRTVVTYKESYDGGLKIDPSPVWTGMWRDANSPSGAQPENALTGTAFTVNGNIGSITVSSDYSQFHLWDNTSVASLQPGEVATFTGLLGYEWDIDPDNGFRPRGLIDLSSTTVTTDAVITQNDLNLTTAAETHNLTLYRADSGALVFSAGSIFFPWGLDSHHVAITGLEVPTNSDVQQLVVNLLAEMGVQPDTIQSHLLPGVQSTDVIPPSATITGLDGPAVVGHTVQITGDSADGGGGVVAGTEVSTDGGVTWHKTNGFEHWSYDWTPTSGGNFTILARSVDDSLNLGSPTSFEVAVNPAIAVDENTRLVAVIADPAASLDSLALASTVCCSCGLCGALSGSSDGSNLQALAEASVNLVSLAIVGGADASLFTIDPITGELSFITPPDYEHPTDANQNNLYDVVVQVTHGSFVNTIPLGVEVDNVTPESVAGDDGDNTFFGSSDRESFFGGGGSDTVSYAQAKSALTASLLKSTTNTGDAAIDGYSSIENLIGSRFNDSLIGDAGANTLEGGPGADKLDGGGGFDTASYAQAASGVIANLASPKGNTGDAAGDTYAAIENLSGSWFADQLTGNSGNNALIGLGGNDWLNGGSGADWMFGGTGDDTYIVDNAGDVVDETGGDGVDLVQSSISFSLADAVHVVGSVEWLQLTGKSSINGTGSNLDGAVWGNSGNNVLAGLGGGDYLDGGGGTDTASYAASSAGVNVSLATGFGSGGDAQGDCLVNIENLTGSNFDDNLEGHAGNNVLTGGLNGAGGDTVSYAHAASVTSSVTGVGVTVSLATTSAQNTVIAGNDTLSGFENLTGSEFNDKLTGNSGNNVLNGLAGNDTINGGAGADRMIGGTGDDTYIIDNVGDIVDESGGDGGDIVQTAISFSLADTVHVLGAVENLTLTGTKTINATGNDLDNILIGNSAGNFLIGLGGNDWLNGGSGADWMFGGTGDDTYIVDNAGDVVDETGGDGVDLVQSSISFSLADAVHVVGSVEWLQLTGKSSINGTGSNLDGAVWGNSGNNVLAGLGGGDYLDGGGGTDTASYAASSAGVNVSLATGFGSGGDAQGDYLVNIENLTGSNFDDTLEGHAGNNVLTGGLNGAGGDTVSYAHAASVTSSVTGVGVTVSLATTSAQNTVIAGNDTLSGFENLTGSEFNDKLTGNSGNNVLNGLAGNDTINGGAGADTIIGGLGADTLTGGTGRDLFVYASAAEGGDTIKDFVISDDTLVFSASGFGGGLTAGHQLTTGVTLIADATPVATTDFGTFLYDTTTHDLTWDADGSGSLAAVQIAHFSTAVSLSADHFNITA